MTSMITRSVFGTHQDTLQTHVIDALTGIRQEWESVANGESLLDHECSVGLLLFDIVVRLEIPVDDQRFLLGATLFDEVSASVNSQS